jgi:hypothetical protein
MILALDRKRNPRRTNRQETGVRAFEWTSGTSGETILRYDDPLGEIGIASPEFQWVRGHFAFPVIGGPAGPRNSPIAGHFGKEDLNMSKALAWYCGIFAVYGVVGIAIDGFEGQTTVYALVEIIVWFALAVGLYMRYRVARLAGLVVCAVGVGGAILVWLLTGRQMHFFLLLVPVFGIPLVFPLHPKSCTEFVRPLRGP